MAKFNIGDMVLFVESDRRGNSKYCVTEIKYDFFKDCTLTYIKLDDGDWYPVYLLELATPNIKLKLDEFKRMKFLLSRNCDKLEKTCKYLDSVGYDVSNVNCLPTYIETMFDGSVKVGHSLAEFAISTAVIADVTIDTVVNYKLNIGSQPSLIEFNNKLYDEDKLNKLLSEAEYKPS